MTLLQVEQPPRPRRSWRCRIGLHSYRAERDWFAVLLRCQRCGRIKDALILDRPWS